MSALALLEKYPLSGKIVSDWVMSQMLESFKDDSVPEDFKNYMLQQGVDNDKLAVMIDAQPRSLFDVFDVNDIIIETSLYPNGEFTIKIGNQATTNSWKTRKEAELFAIEAAFDILENNLSPKIEEIN